MFSTLHCSSGYWQIKVAENARPKKGFTLHYGLYQYRRIVFGNKNAPATFQCADKTIFALSKWQYAIFYPDDIISFSHTIKDHLNHLDTVLGSLYKAELSLNLRKCSFLQSFVYYLGHMVHPEKLAVASKNVDAVKVLSLATNMTASRSLLGLSKVSRRFVSNFLHALHRR